MIENLSQLKKAIKVGTKFKIIEHDLNPDSIGCIRTITKVQTNVFYSTGADIDNRETRFDYGNASDWKFDNGTCRYFFGNYGQLGDVYWSFELIEQC